MAMTAAEFTDYRSLVVDKANIMMGFNATLYRSTITVKTKFGNFTYTTQYNSVDYEVYNLVMNYGKYLVKQSREKKYDEIQRPRPVK